MITPTILQYSVSCPYRIADIPFLPKETTLSYTGQWPRTFPFGYPEKHCIAAAVLLKNIRIMHKNEMLHNAIHSQNHSQSLELLDFEMARTPHTQYEGEEEESIYKKLQKREVIQSLEIVNQIAFYLNEKINAKRLTQIMIENGYESYLSYTNSIMVCA